MRRSLIALVIVATSHAVSWAQVPDLGVVGALFRFMVAQKAKGEGGERAAEYEVQRRRNEDGTIDSDWRRAKAAFESLPIIGEDRPKTADAGLWRWNWIGPGNVGGRCRTILFTGPQEMYTGAVGGGVWKSTNLGGSWQPLTDFWSSLQVTSLAADSANKNIIYAGAGEDFTGSSNNFVRGGLFLTRDGGATWTEGGLALWNAVTRVVAHPVIPNRVFCTVTRSDPYNGVWRSDNGGFDWVRVLNTPDALDIKIGRQAWSNVLVGTRDSVWLSRSDGNTGTWEEQTVGVPKLPPDTQRVEVGFGAPAPGSQHETMWVAMNRNDGELWRSTVSCSNGFQGAGFGRRDHQAYYRPPEAREVSELMLITAATTQAWTPGRGTYDGDQ